MTSEHKDKKEVISSTDAARLSGYTNDYVSRLAREGKIKAERVGSQWLVDPKSLEKFRHFADRSKRERSKELRKVRKDEREKVREFFSAPVVTKAASQADFHYYQKVFKTRDQKDRTKAISMAVGIFSLLLVGAVLTTSLLIPQGRNALLSYAVNIVTQSKYAAYGFYTMFNDVEQRTQGNIAAVSKDISSLPLREEDVRVVSESLAPTTSKDGIVLVDARGDENSVYQKIEDIKNSFSDEVYVNFDETDSRVGTITPMFSGDDENYRFVIVPVDTAESP